MGSDVSHYRTRSTRSFERIFTEGAKITRKRGSHNLVVEGTVPDEYEDGEVRDRLGMLADFKGFRSRLAWGDTVRNAVVLEEICEMEPTLVVDLGCGDSHPIGRCIAAQELDTNYVGVDADRKRIEAVAKEKSTRTFAGLHHDLADKLPINCEVADYVVSLATMSLVVTEIEELKQYLREAHRILVPGGIFFLSCPIRGTEPTDAPVQHPHIHEDEFDLSTLRTQAARLGLEMTYVFNYRARRAALARVETPLVAVDMPGPRLPTAMSDSFMMPLLTFGKPVPGNVLMRFRAGPVPLVAEIDEEELDGSI